MTERIGDIDIYKLPLEKRTFGWILAHRARADAARPYMSVGGKTYTFAETSERVRALARGLAARGIGPGDYLAMMLPNCAEFVLNWYATVLRGAAMVPINPQYRGFLLEAPLRETKTRGLVIHRSLVEALATLDAEVRAGLEWVAIVGGTDGLVLPAGLKVVAFESLFDKAGGDPEVEATYRDIHSVMYTSGTTGPSKGVLISNGQFFSSACVFLRAVALTRDDILFTPLPLFHGLASRLGVLPAMMVGAHVHIDERFSGSQFWQRAAACGATVGHTIFSIPPILKAQPPAPQDRAHRLRCMYNANYDAEFEERFNVRLVEAFGLTETGLFVFTDYPDRRPGSAGRVHEDYEAQIVDDFDTPMPVGQPGEIVLRPKKPFIMMQGYLNKPADTVAAWRNLWFHTGDIGRQDEDGYFYFLDRKKDRIRRRGENVSSWDVENFVIAHPAIAECVALPHPAPAGEDDIRVVVALKPGAALTAPELGRWLETRMPKFMLPRYIEFVPVLPRNPTSKVEKYKLVAQGLGADSYDREAAAGERAGAAGRKAR
jgi:crotonobetaine/carnitine-CoA ligase